MARFRSAKVAFVLALLATLLTYSFDVECLLETFHGGPEITAHADLENCSQPTLLTAVAALLPTTSIDAPPAELLLEASRNHWRPIEQPWSPYRAIPLGRRAPPLA